METDQQNTPQMCWNRVTVTELKFTVNGWRTDRLLWKQTQGYGGWLRRLKAVGSVLLSGSATPLRPAAPDTILYGGSYLRWWNGGEERVQSTADPKNARFRHMSGARQTRTHVHLHTYTQGQKQHKREGQSETLSVTQSAGASRPLYHTIATIQNPLD